MDRGLHIIAPLAAAFACLPASPAWANAADGSEGPIVVTAQRREQQADAVPLSLAVIGRDRLERQGIASMSDLAAQVPGFTMARSFRGPPIFTLRGLGFNSPNISATSPVGFALDELSLPYAVMNEGVLFDLDRVEVLKGPQGTLFGRNTTGGLVNAVAAGPTDRLTARLRVWAGSYASYGTEGAISGPLARDLSARLAFSVDRADKGWQVSRSRGDRLGKRDMAGARLTLRWQPSFGDLRLTAHWWRDRSDTQAPQSVGNYPQGLVALGLGPAEWAAGVAALGLPADFLAQSFTPSSASEADWAVGQLPWGGAVGGRNFTPAPLAFRKDNRFYAVTLKGDFPLGDGVHLRTQTGYARFARNAVTDNAGWAFENAITRGLGSIRSLSQEVRLIGEAEALAWTVGTTWSVDRVEDRDEAWVGTNSLLQVFRLAAWQSAVAAGADAATQEDVLFGFRDYGNTTHQTAHSWAVFGQAEWRPLPSLGVTLGLRHTRDRTRFAGCSRDLGDNSLAATTNAYFAGLGLPVGIGPGQCSTVRADFTRGLVRDRLAENNLSGRFALDWRISPEAMVYASAARGFKAGTFPNIEGNFAVQYAPARQEQVWTFEAGTKLRAGDWLTFDAALFHSLYRNKQVFGGIEDPVFGALTRVLNMPRSHVTGVEAAGTMHPARRTLVEASLAWLRTRVDAFSGIDDFGVRRDFTGSAFAFAPSLQVTVRAEQGFDVAAGWTGTASLALQASSHAQADLPGDPRFRIRGYGNIDAGLSLRSPDGRSEVAVLMKNLTNTYRWNAVHLQGDGFVRFAETPPTLRLSLTMTY